MRARFIIAALPLALAGCQGGVQAVTTEIAVDGCTGYNALMPTMTALNRAGKLSAGQRQAVTYVRNTVGKEICEKDAPPTDAQLVELGIKSLVDGGVAALRQIDLATRK